MPELILANDEFFNTAFGKKLIHDSNFVAVAAAFGFDDFDIENLSPNIRKCLVAVNFVLKGMTLIRLQRTLEGKRNIFHDLINHWDDCKRRCKTITWNPDSVEAASPEVEFYWKVRNSGHTSILQSLANVMRPSVALEVLDMVIDKDDFVDAFAYKAHIELLKLAHFKDLAGINNV